VTTESRRNGAGFGCLPGDDEPTTSSGCETETPFPRMEGAFYLGIGSAITCSSSATRLRPTGAQCQAALPHSALNVDVRLTAWLLFQRVQNVMECRKPSTPSMLCSHLDRAVTAMSRSDALRSNPAAPEDQGRLPDRANLALGSPQRVIGRGLTNSNT